VHLSNGNMTQASNNGVTSSGIGKLSDGQSLATARTFLLDQPITLEEPDGIGSTSPRADPNNTGLYTTPRHPSTPANPPQRRRVSSRTKSQRRQARYSQAEQGLASALQACGDTEPSPKDLQIRALRHALELLETQMEEVKMHLGNLRAQAADTHTDSNVVEAVKKERWLGEQRMHLFEEKAQAIQQTLRTLEGTTSKIKKPFPMAPKAVLEEPEKVVGVEESRRRANLQRFLGSSQRRTRISSVRDRSARPVRASMDVDARRRTLQDVASLRLRPDCSILPGSSSHRQPPFLQAHKKSVSVDGLRGRLAAVPKELVLDPEVLKTAVRTFRSSAPRDRLSQPPTLTVVTEDIPASPPHTPALYLPTPEEDIESGPSTPSVSTPSLPDGNLSLSPLSHTHSLTKSASASPLVSHSLSPSPILPKSVSEVHLPPPMPLSKGAYTGGTAVIFRLPTSPLAQRPQSEILDRLPPPSSFAAVSEFKSKLSSAFLAEPDLSLRHPDPPQKRLPRSKSTRAMGFLHRGERETDGDTVKPQSTSASAESAPPEPKTADEPEVSPLDLPALGLGLGLGLETHLNLRPASVHASGSSSKSNSSLVQKLKKRFSVSRSKK
jgi:hypothetical protein